jgi:hypothetical protein
MCKQNVVVVIALCSKTGDINGVRFEEIEKKHWACDWAFKIKAKTASKEGYDRTYISGTITIAEDYPGCRYCLAKGLLLCSCGILICHDGSKKRYRCPKCGVTGSVSNESVSNLTAQNDS